jgi:signal transduction histidine kinase
MGVIQGHAELLESSVADERGRWRLRTIREQIDRISRIIQALLNTARPRDAVREPVSLEAVIDTSLSFLGEKFRRRQVHVEKQIAPVAMIDGDAEKLQQLFLNLFLNAVDAMPEGGTLTVGVAPLDQGGVEVRIRDSGSGISAERLPRIFDPFYTTKPAGQGSGLGLVVAHSIVLEHDATIDVTSVPGSGAEFRIAFAPRSTPLQEPRPPGARVPSTLSGGTQGPAGGTSSEGR